MIVLLVGVVVLWIARGIYERVEFGQHVTVNQRTVIGIIMRALVQRQYSATAAFRYLLISVRR
jgi:hypothetical protein